MARNDSGIVIICSAVNPAGSASSRAKLVVTSPEDHPPPVIVQGPMNQTLPFKSVATLTCRAVGSPLPVISWYKDGVPVLSVKDKINISDTGTLTIQGLKLIHSTSRRTALFRH